VAIWLALLAAVVLFWIGVIFGGQDDQWVWWQWSAFAGGALCLTLAVFGSRIAARVSRKVSRAALAAGGLLGLLLLGGSLAWMTTRYSGFYWGSLSWPHALAVLGLLGFALFVISATALSHAPRRLSPGSAPGQEEYAGTASAQSPQSSTRSRLGLVGLGLLGGVLGLVIGALIGNSLYTASGVLNDGDFRAAKSRLLPATTASTRTDDCP
jgi:hypothetical protein